MWNTADKSAAMTLSNGDRTATAPDDTTFTGVRGVRSNNAGKLYFEVVASAVPNSGDWGAGIATAGASLGGAINAASMWVFRGNANSYANTVGGAGFTVAPNDVVQIAVDFTNGKIYGGLNNVWQNGCDPATDTSPQMTFTPATTMYPLAKTDNSGGAPGFIIQATEPLGTYSPPAGYSWWSTGYEDDMVEAVAIADEDDTNADVIDDLTESATLTDSVVAALGAVNDLTDAMTLTDLVDLVRTCIVDLEEAFVVSDTTSNNVDFIVGLEDSFRLEDEVVFSGMQFDAWVLNVESNASSRYLFPAFTSLTKYQGGYYGTTEDGLYELAGDDDNGVQIDAFVLTGAGTLDVDQNKQVLRGYIGMKVLGDMYLKVVTGDNVVRTYRLVSTNDAMLKRRLPLGRGVDAVYWQFALENVDGVDFEVDMIHLFPVVLGRRFR